MSRTERSPFMRIVRFVLFIALVGGLAYGAMWVLHRPVALADIAAGPEAYATREVTIHPAEVHEATDVLGYPAVTVADGEGVSLTCVSEHPISTDLWTEPAKVRVHVVEVFGKQHVLLTRGVAPSLIDQAMGLIADNESAVGSNASEPAVDRTRGRVNRRLDFLGLPAFEIITETSGARLVVCQEPAPALNARVTVAGLPTEALRFNGATLSFIEADRVILTVGSLIDAPREYLGRAVTLEGTTGKGLSLAGRTAYEFQGDDGHSIVVWTDKGQPVTGQRGLLTGQANLTEVGGRIIATTMVEQELTLMSAGSDQAGKAAPRVDEADEAPAVLEGIEWSIGTESSESSGK